MTKVNNQIVIIFIGKVSRINTGLMKAFITHITIATNKAEIKPEIVTQGRMYEVSITAKEFIIKFIIISII